MQLHEFLKKAIQANVTFLVVGTNIEDTNTCLEGILASYDEDRHIILIENHRPLHAPNPQLLRLQVSVATRQAELVKASLRMGSVDIVVQNAEESVFDVLLAMGMEYCQVASIIAKNTEEVLLKMKSSIQKETDYPDETCLKLLVENVDVVLFTQENYVEWTTVQLTEGGGCSFVPFYTTTTSVLQEADIPKRVQGKLKTYTTKIENYNESLREKERINHATNYIEQIDHDTFFALAEEMYEIKWREKLKPLLKETVSLVRILTPENKIPIGVSKFGGSPDLPNHWDYPMYRADIPYTFIQQINCAEASKTDKSGLLPSTGWLYFFQAYEDQMLLLPFEEEVETAKVLYYEGDVTDLERKTLPQSAHLEEINTAELKFVANVTLTHPYEYEEVYRKAGFTEEDEGTLYNIHSALTRLPFEEPKAVLAGKLDSYYARPHHQLLGEATFFQGPPMDEKGWLLLSQVWNDKGMNLLWAEDGQLYYYIKEEDLKKKDFTKVRTVFEC